MPDRYGEADRDEDRLREAMRRDDAYACSLCDDRGMRAGFACDHVDYAGAARRGMAMIREAMGWDRHGRRDDRGDD